MERKILYFLATWSGKRKDIRPGTTFLEQHIGWSAIHEDLVQMYLKAFSETELETINAFYSTPAGQKIITTVPQLVQQRNQLAMQRLQDNMAEFRAIASGEEND